MALLVSFGTGWVLVLLSWPDRRRLGKSWLLKLSLAGGLGLGLSSEVYFLWLWMSGRSPGSLLLADVLLLGGLGAALVYFRIRDTGRADPPPAPDAGALPGRRSVVERFLATAVFLALIPAAYAFVSAFTNQPHGGWDAWMSWNLRARFFFRAGEHWRDAFSHLFWGANPEYPVFLPSTVARLWEYSRQETELAPALVAGVFTFATVALTGSSLCLLRSKGQGLLAALLLLGTPFFIEHGTFQMADVPLGFFFLASIVTLCLGDRLFPQSAGPLFLTGLAAGLTVWTKNEGLLFLAAWILAVVAVLQRKGGRTSHARHWLAFAAGLLLVLPLALSVKTRLAPPDIMLDWYGERVHSIFEWPRYWQILKAFGFAGLQFGNWPLQILPLLAFYALLLRIDTERRKYPSTMMAAAALGLTLAGYGFVYLTTPQDLAWHLRTSLNRLLLQLWPSALFVFFLLVNTPEQALKGDVAPGHEESRP